MVDISQNVIKIIFPAEEGILFFFSRTATAAMGPTLPPMGLTLPPMGPTLPHMGPTLPPMGPTLPPIECEAGFYQEAERPVRGASHFIWCQVKNEQLN